MRWEMNLKGKKMSYKVLFSFILFIAIMATSVTLDACSSTTGSNNPGYVLETLTKRDISFSFEYPVGYEKSDPNPYDTAGSSADVVGERYLALYNDTKTSKQINIQLWIPTSDYPSAKARLDYYASNIENVGQNPEITERSPLSVAGIDGEKLVYTYLLEDSTDMPNRINCWIVAFEGKGQIWFISMGTNMLETDEAQADFEHLINTFKILD